MTDVIETATPTVTTIAFKNTLPSDVVIYDSFSSDQSTSYVGDLTQLATVPAGSTVNVPPKHPFASVFIVTHKDSGIPIARFIWVELRPKSAFVIGQSDVDAMNQASAFIEFITTSPADPAAKNFLALIGDTSSDTQVDDVDAFFARQEAYKLVTFAIYMLAVTVAAQPNPAPPPPQGAPLPQPVYSLSRLVALMGGAWPSGLPDILVEKYKVQDSDGTLSFWAEIDLEALPAVGPGPIAYFTGLLGGKVMFSILFHHGFDLGLFGTRLMLQFDDLRIPLDSSHKLKINKPTVTIDINPLFKFVVFSIAGTIPFTVFGKSFDALATMTIDNIEAAVGLVIQGDHASLPGPPQLRGMHFDEFGVGLGIFFEPPSFSLGLEGKFHIGGGQTNTVALDDDTFALVLQIEGEEVNPLYASFYVPKLDLDTLLALFTDTRTGIDIPIHFTDLSFVWAEDPMEPVVLPDGSLSDGALAFSAAVQVLFFSFYGQARVDLNSGLTADVEVAPVSLGPVFKLSGDGKGVTIKVDEHGNPIRNNEIRDKKTLQDALKTAKDKTLVPPGGPVLRIETSTSPYLHLNGKASLFELDHIAIAADIDKSGIHFEMDFGSVLSERMKITLSDFHNLDGSFGFGIDRSIALPQVGPVSLGSLALKAVIAANLKLLTNAQDVTMSASAGFQFEGLHFDVPQFSVDVHIAKMTDLITAFVKEIEAEARKIFGAILNDARRWARWVAGQLITGIDDMAPVLKIAFNQSLKDATSIMHDVSTDADKAARGAKEAYDAGSAQVAQAMKDAGYNAAETAHGLQHAFNSSQAELSAAMRGAGFIASDVARALRSNFNSSMDDAAKALRSAGYPAEAVGGALRSAFTGNPEQAASALRGAGYAADEVGRALKDTFVNSPEDAARALQAAGFAPDQIAGVAKNVYGASAQSVAGILKGIGVAGDAASGILQSVGYPASEIADALKGIFSWPPHINLPHIKIGHVKFPHIKF